MHLLETKKEEKKDDCCDSLEADIEETPKHDVLLRNEPSHNGIYSLSPQNP